MICLLSIIDYNTDKNEVGNHMIKIGCKNARDNNEVDI